MAWVAKAHNAHLIPTPCYVQGRQPAAQAAQSHIQPGLECLQGWGIHSLLGQPVQYVTTLWGKNFLLISNLNLPCLSLKPFPLVLSLCALVNNHSPSCLYAPFKYWKAVVRSPWSLLFSKLRSWKCDPKVQKRKQVEVDQLAAATVYSGEGVCD